jgi:hypothetical protein
MPSKQSHVWPPNPKTPDKPPWGDFDDGATSMTLSTLGSKRVRCGHFRTHWTLVYDADGAWWIQYCDTCRIAIQQKPA